MYSYVNKERCEELVEYRLVDAADDDQVRRAEEIALAAWRTLGCRDGGRIDLRCDAEGSPQFLEANPLAGLHPAHSDLPMLATALGMSYVELIRRIVDSAACRCRIDFGRLRYTRLVRQNRSTSEATVRIVVLHNAPGEDATVDEPDVLVQRDAVVAALNRLGHQPCCLGCTLDLETARQRLLELRPDVVFNLVESLGGTDRLMALATMLLDALQMPYTGARTDAILATSNKLAAKERLCEAGLPTPAWLQASASRNVASRSELVKNRGSAFSRAKPARWKPVPPFRPTKNC